MDSDNSKFKKILWILVLIPICIIGVIIFGRKMVFESSGKWSRRKEQSLLRRKNWFSRRRGRYGMD